ncbi:hypothetical protein Hte_010255 [Hypoxylon texense]
MLQAFSYSKKPNSDRYTLTDTQWFDFVYRTLWLYAIREYQDMLPETERKLAKAKSNQANEKVLFDFASLAYELGVHTKEICRIKAQDPDRAMACRFLQTARKPGEYRFHNLEASIGKMVDIFRTASPLSGCSDAVDQNIANEKAIRPGSDKEGNKKRKRSRDNPRSPNRYKLPKNTNQLQDKSFMFLAKLHSPDERQDTSLSSFFIQRATYFAYFGNEIDIPLKDLASLERDIFRAKRKSSCNPDIEDAIQQSEESKKIANLEKEHARELASMRQQVLYHKRLQQEQQVTINDLRVVAQTKVNELARIANEEQRLRDIVEQLKKEVADRRVELEELAVVGERNRMAAEEERARQARVESLSKEQEKQQSRLQKVTTEVGEQLKSLGKLRSREDEKKLYLKELDAQKREQTIELDSLKDEVRKLAREKEELRSNTHLLEAPNASENARENETITPLDNAEVVSQGAATIPREDSDSRVGIYPKNVLKSQLTKGTGFSDYYHVYEKGK